MMDLWTFAVSVFTGMFAITNPVANVPIFLSLVGHSDPETKRRISKKAATTAFLIALLFIVLGKFIFEMFGITIPAFKITGGILIFYVGFEMLQSKKSAVRNIKNIAINEDIAISPLAIPLSSGPGTIVTAMNFVTNAHYVRIAIVIGVVAIICYLNYLAFRYSQVLSDKLGSNLLTVMAKIMGLIIAIIGTKMIIDGLHLAFHLEGIPRTLG